MRRTGKSDKDYSSLIDQIANSMDLNPSIENYNPHPNGFNDYNDLTDGPSKLIFLWIFYENR